MTAARACLAGVMWWNLFDCSTFPQSFVFQHEAERTPALIQNGFVQPGLLFDVFPWFFKRSLCGRAHVLDGQILKGDSAVFA